MRDIFSFFLSFFPSFSFLSPSNQARKGLLSSVTRDVVLARTVIHLDIQSSAEIVTMDLKVPEGLRRVMMQLSPAIAELHKHTNTPRIAFAIKLGALCVALFMTYTIFADASTERIDYKQAITSAVKGKKPVFIHNTLINEIDGPFDNRTIVDLCAKTQWVPGLIFKCEAPEGGVGNVRNIFLNCIRYTIEAGGEYPSPFTYSSS